MEYAEHLLALVRWWDANRRFVHLSQGWVLKCSVSNEEPNNAELLIMASSLFLFEPVRTFEIKQYLGKRSHATHATGQIPNLTRVTRPYSDFHSIIGESGMLVTFVRLA